MFPFKVLPPTARFYAAAGAPPDGNISHQKNFPKALDKIPPMWYNAKVFLNDVYGGIAQLARAIGSYPIGRGFKSNFRYQRPGGQAAKTPPFHGGNTGSIPVRVTRRRISPNCFVGRKRFGFVFFCRENAAGTTERLRPWRGAPPPSPPPELPRIIARTSAQAAPPPVRIPPSVRPSRRPSISPQGKSFGGAGGFFQKARPA